MEKGKQKTKPKLFVCINISKWKEKKKNVHRTQCDKFKSSVSLLGKTKAVTTLNNCRNEKEALKKIEVSLVVGKHC